MSLTPLVDCKKESDWLPKALETMRMVGYVGVSGVLDAATLDRVRKAMYKAQESIAADVGSRSIRRIVWFLSSTSQIAPSDATVMPTGAPCGRTPFTLCHSDMSSSYAAAATSPLSVWNVRVGSGPQLT